MTTGAVDGWLLTSLGDIGSSLIGLTYSPSDVKRSGTLVLRSSNIQNGKLAFEDTVYVDRDIPDRIRVRDNDVLICVRNGSRRLIGKSVLLDSRVVGETFGAFMSVYRSDANPYLQFFFQSGDFKRQIDEHLGATINQITNASLNSFVVSLPSAGEQKVISAALSDVDALIATLGRLIAKKRAIKQGMMQELLTGRSRLGGFADSWTLQPLGDLLAYEQPGRYLVSSTDYAESGVPVLTAGKTVLLGYTQERDGIYDALPVVIFDDFTTASKYVTRPFKAKSSAMKMLSARPGVNLRFVYERMQLINFIAIDHKRRWIAEYSKIQVAMPTIEEQNAIATVIEDADRELEALDARLVKARAIKQGMMQQLLSGRVRLPVETTA